MQTHIGPAQFFKLLPTQPFRSLKATPAGKSFVLSGVFTHAKNRLLDSEGANCVSSSGQITRITLSALPGPFGVPMRMCQRRVRVQICTCHAEGVGSGHRAANCNFNLR